MDLASEDVPVSLLNTPINLTQPVDVKRHESAALAIQDALLKSKNPGILVDGLTHRHGAVQEVRQLIDLLKIPVYCTNMGKTIIDDTHSSMVGLYNGLVSAPGVSEAFAKHDLVLVLGSVPSDTNTGGYTRRINRDHCTEVDIRPFEVLVSRNRHRNMMALEN